MKKALLVILFLAVQVVALGVVLEKTGKAYEAGQVSVVYACANGGLFAIGPKILVCQAIDASALRAPPKPIT